MKVSLDNSRTRIFFFKRTNSFLWETKKKCRRKNKTKLIHSIEFLNYIHNKNRFVCCLNCASNWWWTVRKVRSISHCFVLIFRDSSFGFPSTTSEIIRNRCSIAWTNGKMIDSIDGPLVRSICKWRSVRNVSTIAGIDVSLNVVGAVGAERSKSKWTIRFDNNWQVSGSLSIGNRLSNPMNNSDRFGAISRRIFNDWYSRDECRSQIRFRWENFLKTSIFGASKRRENNVKLFGEKKKKNDESVFRFSSSLMIILGSPSGRMTRNRNGRKFHLLMKRFLSARKIEWQFLWHVDIGWWSETFRLNSFHDNHKTFRHVDNRIVLTFV